MRAVLIDDADSALAHLSPIGRQLLAPIVAELREAVATLREDFKSLSASLR